MSMGKVDQIICLRWYTGKLVENMCDLPGRVGGARFTQSPAAVLARLLLDQHSAKTGPLTVTCLVTYLNKDKVKLVDHMHYTGKVHIRAWNEKGINI